MVNCTVGPFHDSRYSYPFLHVLTHGFAFCNLKREVGIKLLMRAKLCQSVLTCNACFASLEKKLSS